jgi:hypothetical protein
MSRAIKFSDVPLLNACIVLLANAYGALFCVQVKFVDAALLWNAT